MLPRVQIFFENGMLGSVAPSADGVVGMVATGVAVTGKLTLSTPYLITALSDLDGLGVTSASADANKNIYRQVKEFYDEAPVGSKLWLMAVANTVSVSDIVDKTKENALKLITAAKGAINLLVVAKTSADSYTPTTTNGIDADIYTSIAKAQELAEHVTDTMFAPFTVILPANHYTGTPSSLKDLATYNSNRVAVLLADTVSGSKSACVGLLAGRIATIPVQRSVARVKTGAIGADAMYIGSSSAENGKPDVIHDLGYITARTFLGKAGYYWSDDKLATATTDDYALLPRRRTIDKACRIAYSTLIEELNNEVPTDVDDKIPAPIIKSLQNTVETAIANVMTAEGNLGVDSSNPNDIGVECYIDPNQNILSTSKLIVVLKIKPYGYAKYIDCKLGFLTVNN